MRSVHKDRNGRYAYQDKDETLDYEADWVPALKGDTIASVSHSASGVVVTASSNTARTITFWVRGTGGHITTTVTTSQGRILQDTLYLRCAVL